ncbi:MAG: MFS transporter [Proteobacteria bacterium]|nr:MFS transporter [Pseudomonadota bacterium]
MKASLPKIVFLSALGNALEFYDFTICAVFIPILAKVFFPNIDSSMAIFYGIFTFGAGFFGRPFGAYLFGYIGDRFGRKKALSLTVGLMGIPTLTIASLPGYDTIGILAPIILVLCRILQGLCAGGEYNGAAVFALEHDNGKHAGLVSGLIVGSAIIGALLATIAGLFVLQEHMPTWSWRIPFVFGGCISLMAYVVRRSFQETTAFIKTQKEDHKKQPLAEIFADHKTEFGVNILYAFVTGVLFYTMFGFLNLYLSRYLKFSVLDSTYYNIVGLLSFMFSCIGFGKLSDIIGLKKALFLPVILGIILSPFAFYYLQEGDIVIGQILLGIICGSYLGPGHCFMLTLFPAHERYTGTSLSFSIGMCLAGSSTAGILVYLIDTTCNLYIPSIYLSFCLLSIGLVLFMYNKKKNNVINDY